MLIPTLQKLFKRDLDKLGAEIAAYSDESNTWKTSGDIANSAGNLCLHLIGNLNAFIGAVIGGSGYQRNRDLEFSLKDVPRAELMDMITATKKVVDESLGKLKEEDLEKEYPIMVFAEKMTTGYFLVHLIAHLDYHLGQINYHRRLIDAK